MADETHREEVGASTESWGAWESAATTVLFSAPAFLLFWRIRVDAGGFVTAPAFDWVDWLIVGAALSGGLALSLVAGGMRSTKLYAVWGLASCVVWFLMGCLGPATAPLARIYGPLLLADLAALVAAELAPYTCPRCAESE